MGFQIVSLENEPTCIGAGELGHLLVSNVCPRVWNNTKASEEMYTWDGFVKTGSIICNEYYLH